MYEFESTMRNNLIFYGIGQEERETPEKLLLKVKDVVKQHLKVARDIGLVSVSRIYTGKFIQQPKKLLIILGKTKRSRSSRM